MSFMIDWILLIIAGGFAAWLAKRKIFYGPDSYFLHGVCVAILIIFYGVSIPLFLDLQEFPLVPAFMQLINSSMKMLGWQTYANGTDFMVNFPIHFVDVSKNVPPYNNPYLLLQGIVGFILYPLWIYIGAMLGRVLFGEKPDDKGAVDLLF